MSFLFSLVLKLHPSVISYLDHQFSLSLFYLPFLLCIEIAFRLCGHCTYLLQVEYIHSHLWMMHQNDKRNATLSPLGNVYTSNRHLEIKNYCGDITAASALKLPIRA